MLFGRLTSKKREAFQEPMINVTPLIDVVFVLLISFIIVAPLLETDSIHLAPSGGVETHSSMRPENMSPITIQVLKDNSILVSGKKINIKQLPQVITDLKKLYPKAKPQLIQDKRAFFGVYQEIKNCLELSGFTEMEVILGPS